MTMMERTNTRTCPTCQRTLDELENGTYRCSAHGEWAVYGPSLLVRVPRPEERRRQRLTLPWESSSKQR